MRKAAAALHTLAVILALAVAGCSEKKANPLVEPVPPTYPPVTVAELIAGEGGTGGGPNMGSVTIALFDKEDDTRVAGATVILRHGSILVSEQLTDAQGVATFPVATPGSYSFTAVKANYVNLTVVDINASTVALPMDRRAVGVVGSVTGVSLAGTRLAMDFAAKSFDEFENKTSNKYGTLLTLEAGTGTNWNYELLLMANVQDSLVVSEINTVSGKTVNRKVRALGPYTDDQTLNISMPAVSETGLHWVQINASGIRTGATRVVAWHEENLTRYESYRANDGGGGNWTIQLQMPPDKTGAQITLDTYTTPNPEDGPSESFRFSYSSLAADNAVASNTSVTVDMVSVSGDITASAATIFIIDARYNDKSHLSIGYPLPSVPDYFVRIPKNGSAEFRVIGAVNPGTGSIGTMAEHYREALGPLSTDTIKNVLLAATSSLVMTVPIPANVGDPGSFCAITGPYTDGKYLGLPFISNGQTGASDITIDARYKHIPGMTFIMVVQITDNAASGNESMYLRGSLTDIPTQIGSTLSVSLLDVPRVLSPVQGSTVLRNSLFLLWEADSAASADGFTNVKIFDPEGGQVWNVVARGSTLQTQLHKLPTGLSTMDLQNGTDYTARIETARVTGLTFDSFMLDIFPDASSEMVAQTSPIFVAKGAGNTFRVQ